MTIRFSDRLPDHLEPNPIARLLASLRASARRILDLTESNPTRAGLDYPAEITTALADPRSLVYEPSPAGPVQAREAVARYYSDRGFRVHPDRIILTASTSEAYSWLFKLAGDEILAPRPSYPLFEHLARLEGVGAAQYPLAYDGCWSIHAGDIRPSERTRAIVAVNPNNPTGSFLKHDELRAIDAICAAKNLFLVSDEVFADYSFRDDANRSPFAAAYDEALTFSLGGLSKSCGLPQMKLGWIVIGGPRPEAEAARERLELIADTYLSVGAPVLNALPRLLELGTVIREQIRARVRRNLTWLRAVIHSESPCAPLDVEGGWYATIRVPGVRTEEDWCLQLLGSHGVLVQPGFFYDFESEAYLIVSLLTSEAIFQEGVERILKSITK